VERIRQPNAQPNAEQMAMWNGSAARGWIEAQESLDRLYAPFEQLLVQAVAARGARRVLDVGCGTGSTTLAIARLVGPAGAAVGLDLSEPMLAFAKQRAELEAVPPRFICADAQTYAFEPASFDMIVSRFGVMFFDDAVRAFANLRRAAAPQAALHTIVWRSPADNRFMTAAERAAAPFVPQLPARQPDEPGQFAFADRNRVRSILEHGGWAEIDIQPLDVECTLPQHELDDYIARLGPLGRVLQQQDAQTRARIIDSVRAAFDPYVRGAEVRFTAACHTVRASA
jgi:ubiquinone/menaquinone biosynthesis C-methylase UbiE